MYRIIFLALFIIVSTSYSIQAMDTVDQGELESIDRRPTRVVNYTTRAIGNLLNQQHDSLEAQGLESLKFRRDVTNIITDPSRVIVKFFIVGGAHDLFLKVDRNPLDRSTPLKHTKYTYQELACALERMDITLESIKGGDPLDDKVNITIKPKT